MSLEWLQNPFSRSQVILPPFSVSFMSTSFVKLEMWPVKEATLQPNPGEWPKPEPWPPDQEVMAVGYRTDLVHSPKASSPIMEPRAPNKTAAQGTKLQ